MNAKSKIAIATNLPPIEPNTVENAVATRVSWVAPRSISPEVRSITPEVRTTSAVIVQTTIVSANTSNIPQRP